MKKMDLGQAIAVVANVAVMTGIVSLAIEVHQNIASLQLYLSILRDRASKT